MSPYTRLLLVIVACYTATALFFVSIGYGIPWLYRIISTVAGGLAGSLWVVVWLHARADRRDAMPQVEAGGEAVAAPIPGPRENLETREQPAPGVVRLQDGPAKSHRRRK